MTTNTTTRSAEWSLQWSLKSSSSLPMISSESRPPNKCYKNSTIWESSTPDKISKPPKKCLSPPSVEDVWPYSSVLSSLHKPWKSLSLSLNKAMWELVRKLWLNLPFWSPNNLKIMLDGSITLQLRRRSFNLMANLMIMISWIDFFIVFWRLELSLKENQLISARISQKNQINAKKPILTWVA